MSYILVIKKTNIVAGNNFPDKHTKPETNIHIVESPEHASIIKNFDRKEPMIVYTYDLFSVDFDKISIKKEEIPSILFKKENFGVEEC